MRQSLGDPRPRATQEPRKPSLWSGSTRHNPCPPPRSAVFSLIWTSCLRAQRALIGPHRTQPATLQILSYDSDLRSTCTQLRISSNHSFTRLRAAGLATHRLPRNKVQSSPRQRLTCALLSTHRSEHGQRVQPLEWLACAHFPSLRLLHPSKNSRGDRVKMLYIGAHKPAQHSPEDAGLQMRGIDQSYDSSTSHNNTVDMLACVAAQSERGTYCTRSDTPLSAE